MPFVDFAITPETVPAVLAYRAGGLSDSVAHPPAALPPARTPTVVRPRRALAAKDISVISMRNSLIGSLYRFFPTVESILQTIHEEAASYMAMNFRANMLSLMHYDMETLGRKCLEGLLKEYERRPQI